MPKRNISKEESTRKSRTFNKISKSHRSTTFNKISKKNRSTRRNIGKKDFKIVNAWRHDYDIDDFLDVWNEKEYMPIYYVLINTFLLLINYKTTYDKENFKYLLKDIKDYDETKDTELIIDDLINNIMKLYISINLFPPISKFIENEEDNIILYHGIEYYENTLVNKLRELNNNEYFEIPCFMSTTIILDTACRFAVNTENSRKTIIKIHINKNDFNKFKYTYFGDTLTINDNSYYENEILINILTKLQYISTEENKSITYKKIEIDNSLTEETDNFDIINIKFISHSNKTPDALEEFLKDKVKKYKQNAGNKGKVPVRYLPKHLSNKDRIKQNNMLIKSRKLYKKGKYFTRKKLKSYKHKKSRHIVNAEKIYNIKNLSVNNELAKKTQCSKEGLNKIVKKGEGAYYSSGSRPNQTAKSWGYARLASAITGGKSAIYDYHLLEKYCKPSSKTIKLAKKASKKYKKSTVKKVSLN